MLHPEDGNTSCPSWRRLNGYKPPQGEALPYCRRGFFHPFPAEIQPLGYLLARDRFITPNPPQGFAPCPEMLCHLKGDIHPVNLSLKLVDPCGSLCLKG
jgi:hypothetical protein